MREVGTDAIIGAVRYRLNEELDNESLALDEAGLYGDDSDLDAVVRSHIPEALDYVHTAAPIDGLDGETLEGGTDYTAEVLDDGTIDIRLSTGMLRLISFRSSDTPFNVTEAVAEGSAEGRKQLKPYTRGTWDRPCMVMQSDSPKDYEWHLRYHSRRAEDDGDPIAEFIIIPKQYAGQQTYRVCSLLEEAFYDYLTGLVLDTYGEHDRAQIYAQRSVAPTK